MAEDIKTEVVRIIAERLNKDVDKITMDSKFFEDLGADSLDIMELISALEEKFDTKIPDDEADHLTTVGEVVAYVERKSAEANA